MPIYPISFSIPENKIIKDMKYVDLILNHSKFNDIFILSKFSDNVNDPIRFALNL